MTDKIKALTEINQFVELIVKKIYAVTHVQNDPLNFAIQFSVT